MRDVLKIGRLDLPHRLIQAPLAGISCAPFRALFSLYQKPAYAVTEMISANSILSKQLHPRYLAHDKAEGLWCIQLSGNDPKLLYDAVQAAERYKPDLIDLNCGCPKPKIRAKGCGSALLESPNKLEALVASMRSATSLPLTVKIRLNDHEDIPVRLEQSGADALIIHGRTYQEEYDTKARYSDIQKITKAVSIPIIANGDVHDAASMQQCLDETGAAGIMIGRGAIGKPWLYQSLLHGPYEPTYDEQLSLYKQHLNALAKLEGSEEVALYQGRRLLKWYFPRFNQAELKHIYSIDNLKQLFITLAKP